VPGGQSASLAGQTGLDSKASTWLNRVMAQTETQTLHPSYARALRQQLRRLEQDIAAAHATANIYADLTLMFEGILVGGRGLHTRLETEIYETERNRHRASRIEYRDSATAWTAEAAAIRKQLGA
jgi:hypothetical protein